MLRLLMIIGTVILLSACASTQSTSLNRSDMFLKEARIYQNGGKIVAANLTLTIKNENNYAICVPTFSITYSPNGAIQIFDDGKLMVPEDVVSRRIYDVAVPDYRYNSVIVIRAKQKIDFSSQLQTMYKLNPEKLYTVSYSLPYVKCERLFEEYVYFITAPSIVRDGFSEMENISQENAINFVRDWYQNMGWNKGVIFLEPTTFIFDQ